MVFVVPPPSHFITKFMKLKAAILLVSFFFAGMHVHAQVTDSLEVAKATQRFIKAFVNFDWENFRNSFSDDATIFFPGPEEASRRTGRKEIEETWSGLFPEFIDSTKKFDLKIEPQNVNMQLYGNTAIVTFHLTPKNTQLSRRTIVFVKQKEGWKIVHLHASSLPVK
jgi:ketosteroid isomerase-like protein